jgi:ATP-dependent Clp protease adaptor protein ClpS
MSKTLPVSKPGTTAEEITLHFPLYKVLLHNDDHNSMGHVVKALMRVFHFDLNECERIMMEAHQNGVALCAIESMERAEHHRDQLISFSLMATIEPE